VNKEMYIDFLRCLSMQSEGKHTEKWRINIWFLLHDNDSAHLSILVKDFLAKNNVTALEYPPYSTDLAPADFISFLQLKSELKGWGFFDVTDIIKNSTEELERPSQNGFQKCFQHLYSRWLKCIIAQGDYF